MKKSSQLRRSYAASSTPAALYARKRLREACGLFKTWPHNAMRHTLATMHLAHFKDEKRLQLLLGHVDAGLIYSNYRGLETPANAAKFWALRPRLWGLALLRRPEG